MSIAAVRSSSLALFARSWSSTGALKVVTTLEESTELWILLVCGSDDVAHRTAEVGLDGLDAMFSFPATVEVVRLGRGVLLPGSDGGGVTGRRGRALGMRKGAAKDSQSELTMEIEEMWRGSGCYVRHVAEGEEGDARHQVHLSDRRWAEPRCTIYIRVL
ncbi:hypothetical protein Zm00014a_038819 [Zea mays]|uniref:Uncharacterized protein n=1 Tax=Zea mays TaxID=4577 RepID=A0A3L6DXE2_MAIZE|nr:hypothetical protein Zm00014a_038819 [Zea mays]